MPIIVCSCALVSSVLPYTVCGILLWDGNNNEFSRNKFILYVGGKWHIHLCPMSDVLVDSLLVCYTIWTTYCQGIILWNNDDRKGQNINTLAFQHVTEYFWFVPVVFLFIILFSFLFHFIHLFPFHLIHFSLRLKTINFIDVNGCVLSTECDK